MYCFMGNDRYLGKNYTVMLSERCGGAKNKVTQSPSP